MQLVSVEKKINNEKVRLSGIVRLGSKCDEIEVYFEYPQQFASFVSENADAFVPALLLPSMDAGEDLEIKPPVSEQLLRNLFTIQDIFHMWFPDKLRKVRVFAREQKNHSKKQGAYVGAFFSLGVDSFYTLHKDLNNIPSCVPPISHLIYMKGVECPLGWYKDGQEKGVISEILEVARETKKDCIFGETNIRNCFPLTWSLYYHGAGLASVALSLSAGLRYVLIPATHPYKDISPFGSSPLVDHLWSTEKTIIVHDGAEIERAEKITSFLAKDPVAMKYLRVCVNNKGGLENCGKCWKCIRTMISLYISGNLDKAETFPVKLPGKLVVRTTNTSEVNFAKENLRLAKRYKADKKLIKAISCQVDKAEAKDFYIERSFLVAQKLLIAHYLAKWMHRISSSLRKKSKVYSSFVDFIKGKYEPNQKN